MEKKFVFPHTYVILFSLLCVLALSTYIIPPGSFDRVIDAQTGLVSISVESFKLLDEKTPVSLLGLFLAIQKGFVNAGSVIFLIFFAYFCVYTVNKTGSLHAAIAALLKRLKGKERWTIPIFFLIYALAGSTYGEWDTIYGLIPIMVGFSIAIGYDAMVGLAISGMAVAVGFASATTNPFTIGIAQSYGELPLFSGLAFRGGLFVVFVSVSIWWTMRYAHKIKADPSSSLTADITFGSLEINSEQLKNAVFGKKEQLTMLFLAGTIGTIVFGTLKLGWYLDEMSALFLMSAVFISFLWRISPNQIAKNLLDSSSEILIGAFIVGFSRAVLVVLQDANIIDTIIYYMYLPFQGLPKVAVAEGMLLFQNCINFFIPSGSGQATAVMPIMIPLADLAGLNRQVAVLAYQLGDGYSNLFWPTGGIIVMCSIAKIPLDRWYKFFLPLFGIMLVLEAIVIALAVAIEYGPF